EDKCNADIDTLNNTKNRGAAEATAINRSVTMNTTGYLQSIMQSVKYYSVKGTVSRIETPCEKTRSYEDRQRAIENLQGNSISYNSIVLNNDTVNGNWYGLYSNAGNGKTI
ncbi:MAG: hypothetical protein IPP73_05010, partial [Chitinophagaceae bacterium]|nr:hypothetical protein [Chitinophagaceae bacterium]